MDETSSEKCSTLIPNAYSSENPTEYKRRLSKLEQIEGCIPAVATVTSATPSPAR